MKTVSEIIDANSTARSYSSAREFMREQQLNKSMNIEQLEELSAGMELEKLISEAKATFGNCTTLKLCAILKEALEEYRSE
jgi:hypothetical protein